MEGSCRVSLGELGETVAEAVCVLLGDGEDADAALGAAGAADQVGAGTQDRRSQCGVYDLDEGVGHLFSYLILLFVISQRSGAICGCLLFLE
jgi:hypothetical protein